MSLPLEQPFYTEEEYLALERESEDRHYYVDGEIYEMAGESEEHADISVNFVSDLRNQLRGGPCRVWTKDVKIRSGPDPKLFRRPKGLYSYPDIVVVCGERQYHDEHQDVLLNPIVVIEVLSPSTEAFDRGEKFLRYRTFVDSLIDYVVVSQTRPLVEDYRRQLNGEWVLTSVSELAGELHLASINCTLRLTEIYDRVSFPMDAAEDVEVQ